METMDKHQSFFVKVEGQVHSNHRNPRGVYKVEVVPEKSINHSAYAAFQVAKDYVPFLHENLDYCTLRAFLDDGREIVVPRPLAISHELSGHYCGRAKDYPECITVQ